MPITPFRMAQRLGRELGLITVPVEVIGSGSSKQVKPLSKYTHLNGQGFSEDVLEELWWSKDGAPGLAIYSNQLLQAEADSKEGDAALRELGLHQIETPTWGSTRGHHYLFKVPTDEILFNAAADDLLGPDTEVLRNKIIVIPPTPGRTWVRGKSILSVPPARLPKAVVERLRPGSNSHGSKKGSGSPAMFEEGERNDSLFRIAAGMRARGEEEPEILAELLQVNKTRCRPPLSPEEVERIAAGVVAQYEKGDSALAGMFRKTEPTIAQQLVEIATERYRFGQSLEGRPFAVPLDGPNIAREISQRGTSALQAELSHEFHRRTGRVANQAALADAKTVLLGMALEAEREPWAQRIAQPKPSQIIIDLGDVEGRAIEVGPEGWSVLDRSPFLFRRTAMTQALPVPEPGGDIADLQDLLNVRGELFDLLVAWLVAEYFPDIPRAVLFITGEYGTAKTWGTNVCSRLIDPTATKGKGMVTTPERWLDFAASTYALVLENISYIPDWLSDAVCRVVTGEGTAKRGLYTDDTMHLALFRRAVIINGIDVIVSKGDLGDRLLPIELRRIRMRDRKEEALLERRFTREWPRFLGGLLDVLSDVLAIRSRRPREDTVSGLPRMADFARIIRAVDLARGTDALTTYKRLTAEARRDLALEHPIVAAITSSLSGQPKGSQKWKGSPTDLLNTIQYAFSDRRSRPRSARVLSARLTELAPNLRAAKWSIEQGKSNGVRWIALALPGTKL